MENDTRVLFCLVEGDTNPFEVTVPAGRSISFLKEVIYEKINKGPLRDTFPASDLVLWKVIYFSRNFPLCNWLVLAAQQIHVLKTSQGSSSTHRRFRRAFGICRRNGGAWGQSIWRISWSTCSGWSSHHHKEAAWWALFQLTSTAQCQCRLQIFAEVPGTLLQSMLCSFYLCLSD